MIEIRDSTISGAGKGVFATIDIPEGTHVCEYTGKVIPTSEDFSDRSRSFAMKNGNTILGDNIGSFINDNVQLRPLSYEETKAFFADRKLPRYGTHNCKYFEWDGKVFVVTTRDVKKDEELFTDYGFNYWGLRIIKAGFHDRNYPITKYMF